MEGMTMAELKVRSMASSRERKEREGERGQACLGGGTAGGPMGGALQEGVLGLGYSCGLPGSVSMLLYVRRKETGRRKKRREEKRERKEKKKGRKKRKNKKGKIFQTWKFLKK
jgi:hypothetical protein